MTGPDLGAPPHAPRPDEPPAEARAPQLASRVEELTARLVGAEREILAMRSSLSWRLTHFLRVGNRELGRLRRGRTGAISRQIRALRRKCVSAAFKGARFARPRVGRVLRSARRRLPGGSPEWKTRPPRPRSDDAPARVRALRTELERGLAAWPKRRRIDA